MTGTCKTIALMIFFITACIVFQMNCEGNKGDDDDNASDDDTQTDDDDNADDDVIDDDTSLSDDDSIDDDTAEPPKIPSTHDTSWNCYICHEGQHGGTYTAPLDCLPCHQTGGPPNPPQGPGLPNEPKHDPDSDCYSCHGVKHGGKYSPPKMCLVCHQ